MPVIVIKSFSKPEKRLLISLTDGIVKSLVPGTVTANISDGLVSDW